MMLVADDDPILRARAAEVEPGENLSGLCMGMFEVMVSNRGMGLAAPQVGVSKRVIIGHHPRERWSFQIVNPRIVSRSEATTNVTEGCLSFPGKSVRVERHRIVRVEGFSPQWKPVKFKARGWLAFCLQHEIDHLEGVLMEDRAL
jgi:peptide deformylase